MINNNQKCGNDDKQKAYDDLNKLFNIADSAKQFSSEKEVKFSDIWNNIKNLQNKTWFNIDTLVQLLQCMDNLDIYAEAADMCSMLRFFKDHEKNLKFNKANTFILKRTEPPSFYESDEMLNFRILLSFIITNTDQNENDTLTLDAILQKMEQCKCSDMTELLKIWNGVEKNKQQPVNIANILDNSISTRDQVMKC